MQETGTVRGMADAARRVHEEDVEVREPEKYLIEALQVLADGSFLLTVLSSKEWSRDGCPAHPERPSSGPVCRMTYGCPAAAD